ncbi:hypothetical protein [Kitasatospora sp. NPDC057738]|uniref:hypothetical protein n=1 Tax=Kitasatospora sp. NPDC057738 TaxID=3346233 RepID=UPI00369C1CD1
MDARIEVAGGDEPREPAPAPSPVDGTPAVADRVPAPPVRTPPPRPHGPSHPLKGRPAARVAARVVARVLLVLTGLAAVALGFSWFVDAYDAATAYRSAPACAAPAASAASAPATDCTTHETGRVTDRRAGTNEDSPHYEVTVSREAAPTDTYAVSDGLFGSVRSGDNVDLTLWNGHVVEISHQGHRSPVTDVPWLTFLELALLVGAGTLLAVHTLLRRGRDSWVLPAIACLFLSVFAFAGSVLLIALQWSFAFTLTVPIVGWLALTTAITAMCWED